jgi:DNA adenine methylase
VRSSTSTQRALSTQRHSGRVRRQPDRDRAETLTLRPPLKWAGGKRWQVDHLRTYWAQHADRRLVEPFCGGLAVTMGLSPRRALLNDVNPHVINFYRWLKSGLTIDGTMLNSKKRYYQCRDRFNQLLAAGEIETAEAASLFYYLNRTGYNGLCRFNRSGGFNVPLGRYKAITYRRDFSAYAAAFADWEFTSTTFRDVRLRPDDFVYADPPYDVDFTHYSKDAFGWDAQVQTAEWLAEHPGPVVLSNQATPRICALYRSLGYRLRFLKGPRRISCTGDRTPATEVLALRNVPDVGPAF